MDSLANLTPWQQIRSPRLGRRSAQLALGLWLYGASMAMMVESHLGLDPWDVLHDGISKLLPLSFGTVVIVTGAVVLLLWVPLRQMPGLGTLANAIVIGLATDASLAVLHEPSGLVGRAALLASGIVLNAAAGGLYIGAQLGPGPRDGLMTGVVRRTGWSVRAVRTSIEIGVLAVGFLLGGTVGIGTLAYALTIGPLVQLFLPRFVVPLTAAARTDEESRPVSAWWR